jgi:putative transposase
MPRIARALIDQGIYHVINRGNARQDVFHKEKDDESFVELLREARDRWPVKILAYCIMPNHFHMAPVPEQAEYLSPWMQWVMTSHVRKYHRHYGSSGHVWQGRYKSFIIQDVMVLRYIEGNPVRAGIVKSAKDSSWSSHRENAGITEKRLTGEIPIVLPTDWTSYVDEPMTAYELERLRECARRQAPYGNDVCAWPTDWNQRYAAEEGRQEEKRDEKK